MKNSENITNSTILCEIFGQNIGHATKLKIWRFLKFHNPFFKNHNKQGHWFTFPRFINLRRKIIRENVIKYKKELKKAGILSN